MTWYLAYCNFPSLPNVTMKLKVYYTVLLCSNWLKKIPEEKDIVFL